MLKNRSYLNFKKNGYEIINIGQENKHLKIAQDLIKKSKISNIAKKDIFSKKCISLQNKIYKKKIHLKILDENKEIIKKILKIKKLDELSITAFVHFRGVKKMKKSKIKKNFLGFHRETFYSDFDYTKYQINISIPLLGYNQKNSMKIIKGTHKIPDKSIKTKKLTSVESGVKRFSTDHLLGLPYNPKVILDGVNLKKAKRANLKVGQAIIFSAMTIHGNGSNNSKNPRYSIDFGLIKKKYLKGKKIKEHGHISYSKNGKYWTNIH